MANAIYSNWKERMMQGTANYDISSAAPNDVYCALVDTGTYTFSDNHQFASDLQTSPDIGVVGTPVAMTLPTVGHVARATFDAADVTFVAVTGATVEALVIYRHNAGANTTWPLIVFLDTGVTGLPLTPNSGNVTVQWAVGGIFTLSDGEVKDDVVPIGMFGVATVYEYRYRDEPDVQFGFIAQEVEQFAPEAVREFDGRKHVNYLLAAEEALRLAP